MKNDGQKKKPSIISVAVILTLILSVLLIVFRSEQGPIFGLLIVAACFVFPVMALFIIGFICMYVKQRVAIANYRAKRRKMRRYRKKYITEIRREVPDFGLHLFEKDSNVGKVTAHIFSDFDTPHNWESTEINVDVDEPCFDGAVEALGYINDNRDVLVERISSALLEFFGKPANSPVPEDTAAKPFEIPYINVYSENGELWVNFEGAYFSSQNHSFSARLSIVTNELTLED